MDLNELKQMPWDDAFQYLIRSHDLCLKWMDLLATFNSVADFLERASAKEKSEAALWWARQFPEDREVVRPLITRSEDAYCWAAKFPEDREIMRPLVTRYQDTYCWAIEFPEDKELMRPLITTSHGACSWLKHFPDDHDYFVEKNLIG